MLYIFSYVFTLKNAIRFAINCYKLDSCSFFLYQVADSVKNVIVGTGPGSEDFASGARHKVRKTDNARINQVFRQIYSNFIAPRAHRMQQL